MPEMGTSGLMSGDGKRGGAQASVLASILDSTTTPSFKKAGMCPILSSIYITVNRLQTDRILAKHTATARELD